MARINDIFGVAETFKELQRNFNSRQRTKKRRHTESTFQRGYISSNSQVQAVMQELRKKGEHVLTAAKAALKEGVNRIVADAKSRCPVKTGKLKESVKALSADEGGTYYLTADATNDKNIAYAQFVEFDPRIARPFLYPAIDAHIDEVNEKIKNAIDKAVAAGG